MDKINRLIVKGFKRFLSKDIKVLDATFTEPMQLVLGSNGSGKSSLLEILTGMPPDKNDYLKDGGYELDFHRAGRHFILKYKIGSTVKCHFEVDGEVLNDMGTASVQKDLLLEHLNMDKDVHELMTGLVRFTEMSPSKRREWFTKMANVDMSYLINVYKRAKDASRDNQGALKHVQTRLANEQAKLLGLNIEDGLETRTSNLTNKLNELLTNIDSRVPSQDEIERSIRDRQSELSAAVKELNVISQKALELKSGLDLKSFDDIIKRRTSIENEISAITQDTFKSEHDLYEATKMLDDATSLPDLGKIKARIDYLSSVVSKAPYIHYTVNVEKTYTGEDVVELTNLRGALENLVSRIPPNVKPDFSREEANGFLQELREQKTVLAKVETMINTLTSDLSKCEHDKVSCENCQHEFSPSMPTSRRRAVERSLAEYRGQVPLLEENIKSLEEKVEIFTEYVNAFKAYKHVKDQYPRAADLWSSIEAAGVLTTIPSEALSIHALHLTSVTELSAHQASSSELEKLKADLEVYEAASNGTGVEYFQSKVAELQSKILANAGRKESLEEEYKLVSRFGSLAKEAERINRVISEAVDKLQDGKHVLAESIYQKHVKLAVRDLQGELASLQNLLNQRDLMVGIIEDFRSTEGELEQNQKVFKKLVKALSPESGLIAKQINAHIGTYVKKMNSIISKIWTYDLTVIPCSMEDGDLNYKFPLTIPSKDKESPDIRFSSEAQGNIIDFVFMCVAREYLGLSSLPLLIDEVGSSFDEEHRVRFTALLNNMLETGRIGQMFVVNHFNAMYGALANSEVLVLDGDNISVPDSSNSHVTFK